MRDFEVVHGEAEIETQNLRQATSTMMQTEGEAYLKAASQACEAAGRLVTLTKEMNDAVKGFFNQ